MTSQTLLIVAGASGGHLFPALAVAEELRSRGWTCVFVVGGHKFVDHVEAAGFSYEVLPASPFNVRNPLRKIKAVLNLVRAWVKAVGLMNTYHPAAVFGTGGYATVATVLAAKVSGVPVVLHEQNVLPGRANRLLARMADKMAITFDASRGYLKCKAESVICTGNPLMKPVTDAISKTTRADDLFLFVTGGSQGARILSDAVPSSVAMLDEDLQKKLTVWHQARPEDLDRVTALYDTLPLAEVRVSPFFPLEDMGKALALSHVVVARAGTSTLLGIAYAGRAAIYVPLTLADGHQIKNAQIAENAGAAVILAQSLCTPEALLPHLKSLLTDPDRRADMEMNARRLVKEDAAARVVDVVEHVAQEDVMSMEV